MRIILYTERFDGAVGEASEHSKPERCLTGKGREPYMSKPVINVTPLIDVLLVLLIIFMVVTPLKPHSFEAKIPSEPTKENVRENPYTIVVAVQPDSSLKLNKELTPARVDEPKAVIDRLKDVFRQRDANLVKERTVFIKAPKGIAYGSVAKVVDAVKAAGASPISLQIDELD